MNRISYLHYVFGFAILLVLITIGVTWRVHYKNAWHTAEISTGKQALTLVSTLAQQIDGELFAKTSNAAKNNKHHARAFEELRQILVQAKEANGLETAFSSPIFTLHKAPGFQSNKQLQLVVMTDKTHRGRYPIGQLQDATPYELAALNGQASYSSPYTKGGQSWTAACAPIYNKRNEVIGIVEARLPIGLSMPPFTQTLLNVLPTAIIVTLLIGGICLFFAGHVISAIWCLLRATKKMRNGEFEYRLKSKRWDEFGQLFKSFNEMADQVKAFISEKNKKIQQLQSVELWKSSILDSLGEAIITTDANGKINFLNAAAKQLTGLSMEAIDAASQHINSALHLKTDASVAAPEKPVDIDQVIQSGETLKNTGTAWLWRRTSEDCVPVRYMVTPLFNLEQKIVGTILSLKEISKATREGVPCNQSNYSV